jgi:hypothetical protein
MVVYSGAERIVAPDPVSVMSDEAVGVR